MGRRQVNTGKKGAADDLLGEIRVSEKKGPHQGNITLFVRERRQSRHVSGRESEEKGGVLLYVRGTIED